MPSFHVRPRLKKKRCDEGVGHAGERSRQGAVPLGTGPGQVNSAMLHCGIEATAASGIEYGP